jgi:hypothetical protein
VQPKTNNNPPPTSSDDTPINGAAGDSGDASNSAINFPNGLDEAACVRYAKNRNSAFDSWAGPQMERIADLHRVFKNMPTKGEKASFPLPIGAGVIESINARLQATLLGKPKLVDAVSEQPEIDNATRDKVEQFVNQQVLEISRKPQNGKAGIKAAIIESVLIWRNLWKQEAGSKMVPTMVPDPAFMPNPLDPMAQPQQVQVGEEEVETVKEYWTWELKSPGNMAWDPNTSTCLQDSPWVRERSRMSYNELLAWQQQGRIEGVERLLKIMPSGSQGKQKDDWEAMLKKADGDANWPVSYGDERAYKVEEWFARLTYKDGDMVQMGDFHFFVVEDQVVINFEENQLRPKRHPFGSCPFIIDPHSVLGLSALDQVLSLQKMVNAFSGHQAALGDRASKPLILYDASSGLTGRSTFMKMFGYQPVDNINGIKEVQVDSGPIGIVQNYLNFLINLTRETTGANEQFQGMDGSDTATEFQGLMAAAGSRFADVADTLSQGWIEPLCHECFLFYKQFGQDGQMVVRTGIEGLAEELTRQELQGDYAFMSTGGNDQAKQQQTSQTVQALELIAKLPPSPEGVFNSAKAVKEIILPNLGQKNSADWYIQPQVPMLPGPDASGSPQGQPPMPPEGDMPSEPAPGSML